MKIFAIVVTYNRLELLKKSIGALRRQQRLDQIVVVNNGSNDGTKEWLDGQADLQVIHQENVGGSGGFHTGIKVAYDEGADWIWCMDDDVFPKDGCLDELLSLVALENTQLDRKKPLGILAPRRVMNGKTFTHEFRRYNLTNPLGSLHAEKLSVRRQRLPRLWVVTLKDRSSVGLLSRRLGCPTGSCSSSMMIRNIASERIWQAFVCSMCRRP